MVSDNKEGETRSLSGKKGCMADTLGIPRESIRGLSCITLIGNEELYIENYISIIEFNDRIIRIKVRGGNLVVAGEKIRIVYYNEINMYIKGVFYDFRFDKRNA